jgi:putative membrane protein
MISYNPKEWFTFIFRFHKADTFRKLIPLMLGIAAYSAIVAFLEINTWNLSNNQHIRNLPIMHNLLGFAISMLLVFRTNTAYDRWWEGRRLWGSLVNNSRNLAMKLSAFLPENEIAHRSFFSEIIPAFAFSLHNHLHSKQVRIELFEKEAELKHILGKIQQEKHVPNQIALLIYQQVQQLYKQGIITGDQLLVLNPELLSFAEICGACERIKNTPIPFSYSVFIKKFIFFYIMTLPFGYVFNLGYFVVPVVVFCLLCSCEP